MRSGGSGIFLERSEPLSGRFLRAPPPPGPCPRPTEGLTTSRPQTLSPGVAVVTPPPTPLGRRLLGPGRSAWLGKPRPGVSAGTRLLPIYPPPPTSSLSLGPLAGPLLGNRARDRVGARGWGGAVGLTVICRAGWSLPVARGRWTCQVKTAPVSRLEVGRRRPEVQTGAGSSENCAPQGSAVVLIGRAVSALSLSFHIFKMG